MAPELINAAMRLALEGHTATAQPLRDLGAIKTFVGSPAIGAMGDIVWTPVFILAIWDVHPWFGIVGLVAVGILGCGDAALRVRN